MSNSDSVKRPEPRYDGVNPYFSRLQVYHVLKYMDQCDRDIKALWKRGRYWRHLSWLYQERLKCEEVKTAEQAETIKRLRGEQYDRLMDALQSEHVTLMSTGHRPKAIGITRAMMIVGELHDAALDTQESPHE